MRKFAKCEVMRKMHKCELIQFKLDTCALHPQVVFNTKMHYMYTTYYEEPMLLISIY